MRQFISTSLLAIGLIAATHAQEPVRPPESQPAVRPDVPQSAQPAVRPDMPAGKSIIVVGCVAGGPAAFTLSNATAANVTAKPGDSPVGTAGISSSYDLSARAGVDLTPHVGHKVEITGTPAEASASAAPNAAPSPGAAGSTAVGKTPAAKLTVTAVKMVSASCS